MDTQQLLRLGDVLRMTALSKTTIYGLIAQGRFPKPIRLGWRLAVWSEAEVRAWIAEVAAARRIPSRREPPASAA